MTSKIASEETPFVLENDYIPNDDYRWDDDFEPPFTATWKIVDGD